MKNGTAIFGTYIVLKNLDKSRLLQQANQKFRTSLFSDPASETSWQSQTLTSKTGFFSWNYHSTVLGTSRIRPWEWSRGRELSSCDHYWIFGIYKHFILLGCGPFSSKILFWSLGVELPLCGPWASVSVFWLLSHLINQSSVWPQQGQPPASHKGPRFPETQHWGGPPLCPFF